MMTKMRKLTRLVLFAVLATIFLGTAGSAWAGDGGMTASASMEKEIRTLVEAILAKGGTSASYAVIQNGNLVLADAVGYLDAGKSTAATRDTLYNIGSASKVYTAVAVMLLVQDGRVRLDDPVLMYLPDFRLDDPRYRSITVRMLLDHSSGMMGSDYISAVSYGGYDRNFPAKQSAYFQKSVLKADPGSFSVYCNEGFDIAQLIVARVSGMPFEDFLQKRLFDPLGLTSACYSTHDFAPGSYALLGSLPHEFMNNMGSGGTTSTMVDVARFGQMFLDKGAGVLTPGSVQEMGRPQGLTFIAGDTASTGYGLGWDNVDSRFDEADFGPGVLDKSAGTSQFQTQLYVIPRYHLAIAMAASLDFAADLAGTLRDIATRVLRAGGIETSTPPAVCKPLDVKPLPQDFERD